MKRLASILLIFTFSSYAYPPHSLDMTEYEYRRYVRPQLKSILQDYQTLLLLLNPELKPIKKTFTDSKTLLKKDMQLKDNCLGVQVKSCLVDLKSIKETLDSMAITSQEKIDLTKKEYLSMEEKINAQNLYANYKQQLLKTQTLLENLLLEHQLIPPKKLYLKIIKNEFTKTVNSFDLFVTQVSDNRFRNDLNSYWSNFVMPVYKFILVKDEKEYFLNNINELNIRWNTLNVRLSKRGKKVSKQVKTLINIMHNRWNNILKVSINPMKYKQENYE